MGISKIDGDMPMNTCTTTRIKLLFEVADNDVDRVVRREGLRLLMRDLDEHRHCLANRLFVCISQPDGAKPVDQHLHAALQRDGRIRQRRDVGRGHVVDDLRGERLSHMQRQVLATWQ